jgi:hypothetical protein
MGKRLNIAYIFAENANRLRRLGISPAGAGSALYAHAGEGRQNLQPRVTRP